MAENNSVLSMDGWSKILNQIGSVVDDVRTLADKIRGKSSSTGSTASTTQTQAPATYNPNLSISDFKFTPNMYLMGFGLILLLIAYMLSRK